MAESNPLIRAIKNSRATYQEKFDAMLVLMEDYESHGEVLVKPKKPKLIHIGATVEDAKKLLEEDGKIVGLRTGYYQIDQMIRGIRPGDIVVVFGDTMHGKSLFAQNITLNIAEAGSPVLFIGTELVNEENTERFLTITGRNEKLVYSLPIIYPDSIPDYKGLEALVEAAKVERVQLVVIDHLHMFGTDGENQAVGISNICKEIKRVAVKHEIPIVLVSHINEDKLRAGVPHLKDLLGSSAIKQVASFALAIYNEDKDPNSKSTDLVDGNKITVRLRKWRRGNPKHRTATLTILDNARLIEPNVIGVQAKVVFEDGRAYAQNN